MRDEGKRKDSPEAWNSSSYSSKRLSFWTARGGLRLREVDLEHLGGSEVGKDRDVGEEASNEIWRESSITYGSGTT